MTAEELAARAKALEVLLKTLEQRDRLFSGYSREYACIQRAIITQSAFLAEQLTTTPAGGFTNNNATYTAPQTEASSHFSSGTVPGYSPHTAWHGTRGTPR